MTELQHNKTGISIQVGLSGYSFKVYCSEGVEASAWMTPEHLFSCPQMQRRYDQVQVSVFTPKFTLIPAQFHNPAEARVMLAEVADISEDDHVEAVAVPQSAAVLLYSETTGGTLPRVISEMVLRTDGHKAKPLPEVYYMLSSLESISEYNKIVASYMDGYLYLVIAQGRTLLLCNAYAASDLEQHFKSLLQFSSDQLEAGRGARVYGGDRNYYAEVLRYVEENGVMSYGCIAFTSPQKLLSLLEDEQVSQIMLLDAWIDLN